MSTVLEPIIVTPEEEKPIYTEKDVIKDAFALQGASSQEIIDYAIKNFGLDTKQIGAFTKIIGGVKTNTIGGILDWDTSKTLEENIAHVSGTLAQDAIVTLIATAIAPGALFAFTAGILLGAGFKLAGIDLGDELQDLYSEYIDTTIKISNLSGDKPLGSIEDTFLVNQLKKAEELKVKIGDVERQVKDYIGNKPVNENNPIKVELNKDNSIEIKNSDNTKSVISEDIQKNYNPDGNLVSSVSLKSGQTISHIAVGTKYTTKELLEFNNLSEVDARSLPVGFEVQIPKSVNNFEGGYGNIKEYIGQDGSVIYKIPDKNGDIKTIEINSKGEVIKNDFDTIEDIKDTTNQDILTPEQQDYIKKNSVAYKKDKEEDKVKEETHERDEDNSKIGGIIGGAIGGSIGSIIIANNDFSNIEKIAISTSTTVVGQNVGEYLGGKSDAFDNIDKDLGNTLQGAVLSFAISSFFAKNDTLADILGMDGTFVGGLADFTVSYTLGYYGSQAISDLFAFSVNNISYSNNKIFKNLA